MDKFDVVAAGHICLDMSPKFTYTQAKGIEEVFTPGRLINMNGVDFSAGGPVANTGFAISRLGLSVLPMANIGSDEFGNILSGIAQKEIGIGITQCRDVTTSYSVVLSLPGIDRIILHDSAGNNTFTASHIDYGRLGDARLLHFGYPPLMERMYQANGIELTALFERAKRTGITTSLDMSLPDAESESGHIDWETVLVNTLPYVDIFMPSVEEALFMLDKAEYMRVKKAAGPDDFTKYINMQKIGDLGQRILGMGSAVALIKCGANGIYIRTAAADRLAAAGRGRPADIADWADKELFRETYVVKGFKSALAGGDTTIAGFLTAMLEGFGLSDAAKIACKTGALCCTTYDAISGLMPLQEIYRKTLDEPARNVFDMGRYGFAFDENNLIWTK